VGPSAGLDIMEYEKNIDTARNQSAINQMLHCRKTISIADSEFADKEYLWKFMQSIKLVV
jgi:hypothetical protein